MPWESKTVEEVRKEFISAAEVSTNFSSLCREFGITRRTGYKWIERSKETDNLSDRSHAKKNINNRTDLETEKLILSLRTENPGWGAKTIRQVLINQGYQDLPCVKTFNNILKRKIIGKTIFVYFYHYRWYTHVGGSRGRINNYCI